MGLGGKALADYTKRNKQISTSYNVECSVCATCKGIHRCCFHNSAHGNSVTLEPSSLISPFLPFLGFAPFGNCRKRP
jgi:hypothetical protein